MTWIGLQGDKFRSMDEMDGNGWETAENGHRQRKAEASPSPTVGWTGGRMERKAAGVQA